MTRTESGLYIPASKATYDPEEMRELVLTKFPKLGYKQALLAEAAEKRLFQFVVQAWPVLFPRTEFIHGKHIEVICEHLQALSEGRWVGPPWLIITIPPRHMKSLLVNVFWPAWEWIHRPQLKWLMMTYDSGLTLRDSSACRHIMDSKWYQDRWSSRWQWAKDQKAKGRYQNNQGGQRVSSSVTGAGTGEGGERVVCDDVLSAKQAESPKFRAKLREWWDLTMSTRGNQASAEVWIVMGQRLHQEDLVGLILEQDKTDKFWTELRLPMEFDPSHKAETQLGGDWRTQPGEPLWPQAYEGGAKLLGDKTGNPKTYMAYRRKRLGEYGAAAQLDMRPVPPKGAIFLDSWWRFYNALPVSPVPLEPFWFTTWDFAVKGTDMSDWTVGLLIAFFKSMEKYYVCDMVRDRCEFPEQLAMFRTFRDRWPHVATHLIEDKANGSAIVATVQRESKGVLTFTPVGDKTARHRSVAPRVQAGDVLLPDWNEASVWVDVLINEFKAAPKGAHDDIIDALVQAILWNEMRDPLPNERKILIGRPTVEDLQRGRPPAIVVAQNLPLNLSGPMGPPPTLTGRL